MGGPPEVGAWAAEGGYKVAVYRETGSGNGYRRLMEYGEGTLLDAGILWTKRRTYAVLWGVRGGRSDAAEVAAAVQRVLDSDTRGTRMPRKNAGEGEVTGHTRGWQVPILGTQRGGRSRGAGSSRRGAQSAHGRGYGAALRVPLGTESHAGCGSANVGSVPGQGAQGRDMGRGM